MCRVCRSSPYRPDDPGRIHKGGVGGVVNPAPLLGTDAPPPDKVLAPVLGLIDKAKDAMTYRGGH